MGVLDHVIIIDSIQCVLVGVDVRRCVLEGGFDDESSLIPNLSRRGKVGAYFTSVNPLIQTEAS